MASQNYVYTQTERQLWTVGYYSPDGFFQPEKDFGIDEGGADAAAARVHFLNGGIAPAHADAAEKLDKCFDEIRDYVMTVEPNKKTAEQIRDEIYSIMETANFVP